MKELFTGIHNPLISRNAEFKFEVVEDKDDVKNVEYKENGKLYTYPEKQILIRALSGGGYVKKEFIVTLLLEDALTNLRVGEIISLDLHFSVSKDEYGNYIQKVTGDNLFTLHDYYQIREAESFHKGEMSKENKYSD
ncbi:MAG: hypothetical protein IKT00_00120 [Prevotella sp.]|nr:hypothetical protein [Prevotella sp.]